MEDVVALTTATLISIASDARWATALRGNGGRMSNSYCRVLSSKRTGDNNQPKQRHSNADGHVATGQCCMAKAATAM